MIRNNQVDRSMANYYKVGAFLRISKSILKSKHWEKKVFTFSFHRYQYLFGENMNISMRILQLSMNKIMCKAFEIEAKYYILRIIEGGINTMWRLIKCWQYNGREMINYSCFFFRLYDMTLNRLGVPENNAKNGWERQQWEIRIQFGACCEANIDIQYKCNIYVLISEERSQLVIQIWELWKLTFVCPDVFCSCIFDNTSLWWEVFSVECTDPHLHSTYVYDTFHTNLIISARN